MPSYRHHWAIAALIMVFLAASGAWAYQKWGNLGAGSPGVRGYTAIGIALLIVVGKMLLKGRKNAQFNLHEQGEELSLLAVGAAFPTAADYVLKHSSCQGEWIGFAGGAVLAMLLTIYASGSAGTSAANTKERAIWTGCSMILGIGSFFMYMFLLVLKTRDTCLF